MGGVIVMNGMKIEVGFGGRVLINGVEWGPKVGPTGEPVPPPAASDLTLDRDGRVPGPIPGDLRVTGTQPVRLVIEGEVQGNVTVENGSVQASAIGGSVRAGGDVQTTTVGGSVHAGGSVQAQVVGGSVHAARFGG